MEQLGTPDHVTISGVVGTTAQRQERLRVAKIMPIKKFVDQNSGKDLATVNHPYLV